MVDQLRKPLRTISNVIVPVGHQWLLEPAIPASVSPGFHPRRAVLRPQKNRAKTIVDDDGKIVQVTLTVTAQ
jgi:hypothetical protein